jgi:hypothetical protein
MSILRQYLTSKNRINIINSYNHSRKKFTKSFRKETYKGIFIFSLDGLPALFFVLSFGLVLIIKYSSITLIGFFFIIGIPLFILFSVGLRAYYFQLEERSLIVRNHVFHHVKHKINLETVRVIHFEQKFKKESSIRIINNDLSSVSFQSSTLKDKHWKSLIPKLKEREISVIDYLFYEYNELKSICVQML